MTCRYVQNDMQKPSYCHPDEPWRRRISLSLNTEPLYAKVSPKRWMIPNIEENRGKINQAFTKTVIQAWNPTISLIEIRRLKMEIFQGQSREWTI